MDNHNWTPPHLCFGGPVQKIWKKVKRYDKFEFYEFLIPSYFPLHSFMRLFLLIATLQAGRNHPLHKMINRSSMQRHIMDSNWENYTETMESKAANHSKHIFVSLLSHLMEKPIRSKWKVIRIKVEKNPLNHHQYTVLLSRGDHWKISRICERREIRSRLFSTFPINMPWEIPSNCIYVTTRKNWTSKGRNCKRNSFVRSFSSIFM